LFCSSVLLAAGIPPRNNNKYSFIFNWFNVLKTNDD
jgi:hypothetical protein